MVQKETRHVTLICKKHGCPEHMWTETVSVVVRDGLIDGKYLDLVLDRRNLCCPHCGNTDKNFIELAPMMLC